MGEGTGRRLALKVFGAGAAGLFLSRAAGAGEQAAAPQETGPRKLPWAYEPLDPAATAERAFAGYSHGHCAYGSFEALVGPQAKRLGGSYADFPFDLWIFGAGGIQGWGTICGALNGAAAAFQLLSPRPQELTDQLYSWYEATALPDVEVKGQKFVSVTSVAKSPLCHQSVSLWCKAADKKSYSAERKERCGVLTASVARHAAALLNQQRLTGLPAFELDHATDKCSGCHEKGSEREDVRTKMGCNTCHFHLGGEHP
jgi:Putative redox-active protein (C_GCAxxG_C_C)